MEMISMTRTILLALISITVLAIDSPAFAKQEEGSEAVLVIANETVPEDIGLGDIRDAYLSRIKVWSNGEKANTYIDTESQKVHRVFVEKGLGSKAYVIERLWSRINFTGSGDSPKDVDSRSMIEKVRSTPGSVGYVEENEFEATDGIRVIERIE